ncbi:hypothetical protein MYX84_13805 [Acidobacteria bacterium AH-259-O06]|nr:hypothetical protein [Acidobacteria bacterium AH-259-O06]
MIWQTMMGTSRKPKIRWHNHDRDYQLFSESIGERHQGSLNKGDTLIVYWPGTQRYMGFSTVAETGPYQLDYTSDYWRPVADWFPSIVEWPYGVAVSGVCYISDPRLGIMLAEARQHIRAHIPGRIGLRNATDWPGINWLVDEIGRRADG